MDQRYGITRLLFNQSLGCPIAFTEMIRRYGLMTDTERSTFIASLDMDETGAMIAIVGRFFDPFAQLVLVLHGLDVDVFATFTIDLMTHAAMLCNVTVDQLLENDPPVELVKAGATYYAEHIQQ